MLKKGADSTEWIARPWVAAGAITGITGKVKIAGKTTFVLALVKAVSDGSEFLGQTTTQTKVVVLTEQPRASLCQSLRRAGLLEHDGVSYLRYSKTFGVPWPNVVAAAVAECKRIGAQLLVIDTLSQFVTGRGQREDSADDALLAMRPLQEAADLGIGVLLTRHETKKGGDVGDSARGSSAFEGAVDTVISIRRLPGNQRSNLRSVRAISRFDDVPESVTVELTPTGYVLHAGSDDQGAAKTEQAILSVLPHSIEAAITLDVLLNETHLNRATAQRAIENLMTLGRVARLGDGKRGCPFKYYQPEQQ